MPRPIREISHILVGEAANQGTEGMAFVYDVMNNQTNFFGGTVESTANTKYAAANRADFDKFILRQPQSIITAAYSITDDAPDGSSQGGLHFENLKAFGMPRYAKQEGGYIPLAVVGDHTSFITLREYRVLKRRGTLPASANIDNLVTP